MDKPSYYFNESNYNQQLLTHSQLDNEDDILIREKPCSTDYTFLFGNGQIDLSQSQQHMENVENEIPHNEFLPKERVSRRSRINVLRHSITNTTASYQDNPDQIDEKNNKLSTEERDKAELSLLSQQQSQDDGSNAFTDLEVLLMNSSQREKRMINDTITNVSQNDTELNQSTSKSDCIIPPESNKLKSIQTNKNVSDDRNINEVMHDTYENYDDCNVSQSEYFQQYPTSQVGTPSPPVKKRRGNSTEYGSINNKSSRRKSSLLLGKESTNNRQNDFSPQTSGDSSRRLDLAIELTFNSDSFTTDENKRSKRKNRIQKVGRVTAKPVKKNDKSIESMIKPVTVMNASTSIVGSRPSHWCRDTYGKLSTTPLTETKRGRTSVVDKRSIRKKLAEAVLSSKPSLDPSSMEPPPSRSTRSKDNSSCFSQKAHDISPNLSRSTRTDPTKYFQPALVHKMKSSSKSTLGASKSKSPHYDFTSDNNDYLITDDNMDFTSDTSSIVSIRTGSDSTQMTTKSKKGRVKIGRFRKYVRYLRSQVKVDDIRFKSGQYPFTGRNFNGNINCIQREYYDPRFRAKNHVDVTILNEPSPLDKHFQRFAFLAYVHSYFENVRSRSVNGKRELPQQESRKGFVWIFFMQETAREHNLKKGSELRIYNTQWIPLLKFDKEASYITCSNGDQRTQLCLLWAITCTQLCEPYPSNILPVLPPINNLFDHANVEDKYTICLHTTLVTTES